MNNDLHAISLSPDSSEAGQEPSPAVGVQEVIPTATSVPNLHLPFLFQPSLPGYVIFQPWNIAPPHYQMPVPAPPFAAPNLSLQRDAPMELSFTQADSIESPLGDIVAYKDHANDKQRLDALRRVDEPFPVKLHQMLSDPSISEIIAWMPHGRSWKVFKVDALVNSVLPKYFSHTQYASFMRQVNGWGFRRFSSSSRDYRSYYHEMKRPMVKLERILNMAKQPDFYNSLLFLPLPGATQLLSTESNWQKERGQKAKRRPWGHDEYFTPSSDQKPRAKKRKSPDETHLSPDSTSGCGEDSSIVVTQLKQSTGAVVEKTDAFCHSNNVAVGVTQRGREQKSQKSKFSEMHTKQSYNGSETTESLEGLSKDRALDSTQNADDEERSETMISLPLVNQYEGLAPQLTDYFAAHRLLEPHVDRPSQPWNSIPPLPQTFPEFRDFSPFQHDILQSYVPGNLQTALHRPIPFGQKAINGLLPLLHPVPQPQLPWAQLQLHHPSDLSFQTKSSASLLTPQKLPPKNNDRKLVISAKIWRLVQPKTPGPLQMVFMARSHTDSEECPLDHPGSSPSHLSDGDSRNN